MTEKIVQSLRLIDLLADLPEPFLQQLVQFTMLRKVRAGETIFCQGEPSPYCFGIMSGLVTIQRVSRDKNFAPKILSILGPGAIFGENALFKDSPRTAMAIATQDGELVAIQGKPLRDWIEKDPESGIPLMMGLLQTTMHRLRQTSQELSLVYGVGRFMSGDKPIKDRLMEAVNFVRSSLEDIDDLRVYQRSPYWEEFESLTDSLLPAEAASGPASVPIHAPQVREMEAILRPVVSPPQGTQITVLVPLLDPENPKRPLFGFLKAVSLKNPFAFNPKMLLLLGAVSTQITEALLRHQRQDEHDAQSRLRQSRESYPL